VYLLLLQLVKLCSGNGSSNSPISLVKSNISIFFLCRQYFPLLQD